MEASEHIERFQEFLESNKEELYEASVGDLKSINIDFSNLAKFDHELSQELLNDPDDVLKAAELAIGNIELPDNKIKVRIFNLPKTEMVRIRDIRSIHIGRFIGVQGFVRQTSDVRPQAVSAMFECPSCGNHITMPQLENKFREPSRCSCGYRGRFRLLSKDLVDAQRMVVEEAPENLDGGEQPKRIAIFLREDLVDPKMEKRATPGSKINVVGTVKEVTIHLTTGGQSTRYDLVMECNSIIPVEETFEDIKISKKDEKEIQDLASDPGIYEKFVRSIAPSIYGHELIKEAIVLQMMGGVKKIKADGTKTRGDLHVLLVGDPGCIAGDSQVALIYKGMEKIQNIGEKHMQPIKETVVKIRKDSKDKYYDYATVFQHYKEQPVLKVITETGKEIICTYNQPLLTKYGWERADELLINDKIRVMPKIPSMVKGFADTGFSKVEKKSGKLKEINLPNKVTPELASLYGYIIGDGNIHPNGYRVTCYINNEETDIIEKISGFFNICFNVEPSIFIRDKEEIKTIDEGDGLLRQFKTVQPMYVLEVNSKQLAFSLLFLSKKRVPQQIFRSPTNVIAKFISWLFEADGCAFGNGRGRTAIQLKSRTSGLLKDVQLLLLYFGIQSRIIEDNLCIRRSRDIELFAKHIGFNSIKKKNALNEALKSVNNRSFVQIRKSPQRWEKIAKIIPYGVMDVYDFEVPISHSFIANGIICHNSGKSQLLQFVSKTAPKARYLSGKGASAAGLTASVVKDEFLRGWALEAGALVLANMGLACLHPDTKILVDNKIKTVSNLFNPETKIIRKSGKDIVEINEINANVVSIDKKLSVWRNKSNLIRRKWIKEKLKKIVFESGFEIKLTSDHKLIDGNSLKWKPSSKFKKGDFIVSPLKLPENKDKIKLTDILNGWSLDYENKRYKYWKGRSKETLNLRFLNEKLAYLIGFSYGDGHVSINKRRGHIEIKQSLKNKEQISRVKKCFREVFNRSINSYIKESKSIIRERDVYSRYDIMYFGSKLFVEIYNYFTKDNLRNILTMDDDCLRSFIAGVLDSDGCISTKNYSKKDKKYRIQHIEFFFSNLVQDNLNFILALRRLDCYSRLIENVKGDILCVRITGNKDVNIFKREIGERSIKVVKSEFFLRKTKISSISDKLPKKVVSKICEDLSRKYNKSLLLDKGIWSAIYDYKKLKRQPSRDQLGKIFNKLGDNFKEYNFLLKRDYFLDRIKEIKEEYYEGYVYDLFVPKYHNFLANGVIVHNCLDELDKISVEDTSALHEALEQQTITISKANIQATLRTETTVLAAANPKFGRFDPYTPIAAQINMPAALINRFDLIFPIRDMPSKEQDEKIATHVLEIQTNPESLKREISNEIIRKYVAYVKQKIFPKLTKGAVDEIKSFYVNLRNMPTMGDEHAVKPIPISARQLEALVRLSEGSARVRLSNKVERKDARRAIDILKYCLMQVGFDYETGQIDIDRISTGISASERGKIIGVRDIINELELRVGKVIPIGDIINEAKEKGIGEDKVNEALEKLKRSGEIYSPNQNCISKI